MAESVQGREEKKNIGINGLPMVSVAGISPFLMVYILRWICLATIHTLDEKWERLILMFGVPFSRGAVDMIPFSAERGVGSSEHAL
jgi:hypothetical protein